MMKRNLFITITFLAGFLICEEFPKKCIRTSNKKCEICIEYPLINGHCLDKSSTGTIENCRAYFKGLNCVECLPGYGLTPSKTCLKLPNISPNSKCQTWKYDSLRKKYSCTVCKNGLPLPDFSECRDFTQEEEEEWASTCELGARSLENFNEINEEKKENAGNFNQCWNCKAGYVIDPTQDFKCVESGIPGCNMLNFDGLGCFECSDFQNWYMNLNGECVKGDIYFAIL